VNIKDAFSVFQFRKRFAISGAEGPNFAKMAREKTRIDRGRKRGGGIGQAGGQNLSNEGIFPRKGEGRGSLRETKIPSKCVVRKTLKKKESISSSCCQIAASIAGLWQNRRPSKRGNLRKMPRSRLSEKT